jgi:hypothetical protein
LRDSPGPPRRVLPDTPAMARALTLMHRMAVTEAFTDEGINRRTKRWNHEHALKDGARVSLEREVRKLEAAVERLTDTVEKG